MWKEFNADFELKTMGDPIELAKIPNDLNEAVALSKFLYYNALEPNRKYWTVDECFDDQSIIII